MNIFWDQKGRVLNINEDMNDLNVGIKPSCFDNNACMQKGRLFDKPEILNEQLF